MKKLLTNDCIGEGGTANGTVSPEYQTFCCEGLDSFDYLNHNVLDTDDRIVGGNVLCMDPSKGAPTCLANQGRYYPD